MTLDEYMRAQGLTDVGLAAVIGRDRSTVTRWRLGQTVPDLLTLLRLKAITGGAVTPDDWAIRKRVG